MRVFLDSCVVVSFLVQDIYTSQAQEVFVEALEGKISAYVSHLTVAEVCGVIRRRAGKSSGELALKKFL